MSLSERDRAILDFEPTRFHFPGVKEQVVRERFDLTMTRYAQILNRLTDDPDAYVYAPVLVKRLRRLRDSRRQLRPGMKTILIAATVLLAACTSTGSLGPSISVPETVPSDIVGTPVGPVTPQTLVDTSGSGIKHLPAFDVDSDWTLAYTYNCSAFGGTGNFQVYNENSGAVYANELTAGTSNSQAISDHGSIKLLINSECDWTVTATVP